MTTEIIVARHGETEWNAIGRIQGHLGEGLNSRGRRQARAVAQRLAEEDFDALISSDLERAMETAAAIRAATGHSIAADPRLREWDLGVLSGLPKTEARHRHPDAYLVYSEHRVDIPVPGGESIRQRYRRTTAALEEHAAAFSGGRILVVSHGGPLDDFYRRATGMPLEAPRSFRLYNAGLHRFRIDGRSWELCGWGDIAHLDGIGSLGHWQGAGGQGDPKL
jgi:probable phosphoglycerate mutase